MRILLPLIGQKPDVTEGGSGLARHPQNVQSHRIAPINLRSCPSVLDRGWKARHSRVAVHSYEPGRPHRVKGRRGRISNHAVQKTLPSPRIRCI